MPESFNEKSNDVTSAPESGTSDGKPDVPGRNVRRDQRVGDRSASGENGDSIEAKTDPANADEEA